MCDKWTVLLFFDNTFCPQLVTFLQHMQALNEMTSANLNS